MYNDKCNDVCCYFQAHNLSLSNLKNLKHNLKINLLYPNSSMNTKHSSLYFFQQRYCWPICLIMGATNTPRFWVWALILLSKYCDKNIKGPSTVITVVSVTYPTSWSPEHCSQIIIEIQPSVLIVHLNLEYTQSVHPGYESWQSSLTSATVGER